MNLNILFQFFTDTGFTVFNHELLDRLKAKGSDVYHYILGYTTKSLKPKWLGIKVLYLYINFMEHMYSYKQMLPFLF